MTLHLQAKETYLDSDLLSLPIDGAVLPKH